nr:hypothetical protein [Tanacetum cinerariifolium]
MMGAFLKLLGIQKLLERKDKLASTKSRIILVWRRPFPPLHGTKPRPQNEEEPATAATVGSTRGATNVEKEVVDLRGNTHAPTLPATIVYYSPRLDAHSFHSSHHEETEDDLADCQFGLLDDLRICTFRAYKELISHLETPTEEEFLGNLTNAEVVSHAYQLLGQCVLSHGELLKRHEQLNHDYVDLCNCSDVHLVELDCLRNILPSEMQANDGLNKRLALLDSAYSLCPYREIELIDKLKDIEKERDDCRHTAKDQEHRELFTMQYPYAQKVADSYHLSIADLMKVSLDVPPSPTNKTCTSTVDETVVEATFGTTT